MISSKYLTEIQPVPTQTCRATKANDVCFLYNRLLSSNEISISNQNCLYNFSTFFLDFIINIISNITISTWDFFQFFFYSCCLV